MIRIRLPQEESQRLDQAYREEADPKFRDRLQIVRLAARDRPHYDIAQDLAITPRTVQRWLNAYLERGLDGLRRARPKAPPVRSPPGWPKRSNAGSSKARPSKGWTAPTGLTRSWPITC